MVDNNGTIELIKNLNYYDYMKYIHICINFICEAINNKFKLIKLVHVDSSNNTDNVFMKSLLLELQQLYIQRLELCSPQHYYQLLFLTLLSSAISNFINITINIVSIVNNSIVIIIIFIFVIIITICLYALYYPIAQNHTISYLISYISSYMIASLIDNVSGA